MSMTGSGGVFSVPAEHVPGLIALLVTPVALWALVTLIHRASRRGRPGAQRLDARLRGLPFAGKVASVALVVGATVHAAIAPSHWGASRALAILFIVDALGLALATWWTVTGRRHWSLLSATMLGGTVAGYALYLIRGWETPDPVGMLTSTVELAGLFVVALAGHAVFADPERRRRMVAASVGGALVVLVGTVVATGSVPATSAAAAPAGGSTSMRSMPAGGPSPRPTTATMPGMPGGSTASTPTTVPPGMPPGMPGMSSGTGGTTPTTMAPMTGTAPAGSITWPLPMSTMEPGMQMVTPNCTAEPTPGQQQAAVTLVDQTVADSSTYRSLDAAKAAGYVPVTPPRMPIVHYVNPAYLRSPGTLQPGAIEALVYANTAHGAVLAAAMYAMGNDQAGATPPMPGGCLTEWHVHTNLCFSDVTGTVVGAEQGGVCRPGSTNRVTQPMLHVWLAPVPGGPLTVDASRAQVLAAASQLPAPNPPNPTA